MSNSEWWLYLILYVNMLFCVMYICAWFGLILAREHNGPADFTYMDLLIVSGCKPRKDSGTPRADAKSKSRYCHTQYTSGTLSLSLIVLLENYKQNPRLVAIPKSVLLSLVISTNCIIFRPIYKKKKNHFTAYLLVIHEYSTLPLPSSDFTWPAMMVESWNFN